MVVIVAIVGGYLALSGNGESDGNGSNGGNGGHGTITSLDFYMKGYEEGDLGGESHIRTKDIGTGSLKLRIDQVDGEEILIFDYEKNVEYAYTGSSWIKISDTQANPYSGIPFEEWAQEGPGTYEFSYEGSKVEVEINSVNPSLEDNLFAPPENADVETFGET